MLKKLFGIISGIFILLLGARLYASHSASEVAGVLDQLNPLVFQSELYVKTGVPQSVNEYGTASYKQLAANKDGETRTIRFNGLTKLKTNRYLKLTNKGAHVETYEELRRDQVPEKALKEIDSRL
ncbi:YxeA family protein [Enterococcus xiangfangensis]|uniref:YxeA family protein n=1 Tax=Enterococcus xiangfangensis TaxID=1296537 RepID=A0ABU3F8K3_9ENTE|nr:YxeA family protein [Enterococcus xiangfangensis]MDT2758997.1 YxeA family protein [Enterococcus xiangfangensis]NBK07858.1 YxeA family protein [Enterococcus asini]